MSTPTTHLDQLARRLTVAAWVSLVMTFVSFLAMMSDPSSSQTMFLVFVIGVISLVISGVGAIVGRLMLADRRDSQTAPSVPVADLTGSSSQRSYAGRRGDS